MGVVLLFGKQRERYFPDAWIQAGRFRGIGRAHIADSTEIHGYSAQTVKAAVAFVHKHDHRAGHIGAMRRVERWKLPPASVREAVIGEVGISPQDPKPRYFPAAKG